MNKEIFTEPFCLKNKLKLNRYGFFFLDFNTTHLNLLPVDITDFILNINGNNFLPDLQVNY